jgi:acetamidase/formamidase
MKPNPHRPFPALLPFLLLFTGAAPLPAAEPTASRDLSGWWEVKWWSRLGETNINRLQLAVSDGKISGKGFNGDGVLDGTCVGETLEFKMTTDGKLRAEFNGVARGGTLSGSVKFTNNPFARFAEHYDWTAQRAVPRPAKPTRYEFEPKQYYRAFSDAPAPAFRIFPGDTVHTHTIDAGGIDRNGVRQSFPGNPLSGPIFVEGALRGDTLVLHFNRIRLNRDTAESGEGIVSSALEPWYVRDQKAVTNFDSNWKLDAEKGIARLANPTPKLKNFTVPLAPMLGCVGVAPPAHQSFRSGDLGPYGGNMDFNQLREGSTVYLPVFQPGALLYVGDGHAAQGDGELTGDALETSMEVEFTVELLPGKSIEQPRLEDSEYLMCLGIGNSLQDALQQATTGLARWMENDYGLNASEAAMVLGFAMQYQIAEVVDPRFNVVAKIKKNALVGLKSSGA